MFRFTIRDVLWLTVVVALAVGWVVDHYWQVDRYGDLVDKNANLEERLTVAKWLVTSTIRWRDEERADWSFSWARRTGWERGPKVRLARYLKAVGAESRGA